MAVPASAAVVDFTNIRGEWFDIQSMGGPAPTYSGNGTSSASVRWGTSTGDGQSGYDFVAGRIPSLTVTAPGGSHVTTIGTFRHNNRPIANGTSITGIGLKFTTDVLVNSNPFGTVTFVYDFLHEETPNGANPCAYGGANNRGINNNGCADRVQVNFNQQSDFFLIDGQKYALDIVGFLIGGDPATDFLTRENARNTAQLQGRVVLYSELTDVVPEPATWAMMIAGFGLVGASMRRRRASTERVAA